MMGSADLERRNSMVTLPFAGLGRHGGSNGEIFADTGGRKDLCDSLSCVSKTALLCAVKRIHVKL